MASKDDVMTQTDQELVDWANSIESGLTAWELGFVDGMSGWLVANGHLTAKQRGILEGIVEKKG